MKTPGLPKETKNHPAIVRILKYEMMINVSEMESEMKEAHVVCGRLAQDEVICVANERTEYETETSGEICTRITFERKTRKARIEHAQTD